MTEEKQDNQCGKSELLLFEVPPLQVQIEEGKWDVIPTKSNLDSNNVIRFDIPGSSNYFISVGDTELHLDVFVAKADKTTGFIGETTKVAPVNNLLHSLFEQVTVELNNTLVENSNSCYAYRAYMETLLNANKEYKETVLQAGNAWYKDSGDFEALTISETNPGFLARHKLFAGAATIQLCGKLHCDFFSQPRLLLPNVDIGIELTRSRPDFYMLSDDSADWFVHISRARLKVRRVTVSPSATFDILQGLQTNTAKYPIRRTLVKRIVTSYSAQTFSLTDICKGIMPDTVIVGFVKTSAASGNKKQNPFCFQNLNIKSLQLKVNSHALPYSSPLELDFANGRYMEAYMALYKNLTNEANDISYKEFKNGNTLFAFDLTPDMCSGGHQNVALDGSLELDISMSAAFEGSITAYVLLDFNNLIQIDNTRRIIVNYKI